MTNDVVVIGVGLMTAVGLSAPETAAAVRAGTMRFCESDLLGRSLERFTLAEVPEDGLPALADTPRNVDGLTAREIRMLRLASVPLRECLAPLQAATERTGMCVAVPETETLRAIDRPAFVGRLATQSGRAFAAELLDATQSGRAGGLLAIGHAVTAIQSGAAHFMVAGGVDTFRDPYVLGTLDLEDRVKTTANSDGFIPGEGAGFVLLASAEVAAAHGLALFARISPTAVGFEPGHLYSTETYRGDGLAQTIGRLVNAHAVDQPVAEVYSSMNGENHWAKEWGVGYLRNKAIFQPTHGTHHPADSYGDTGAASGPLMVGLASLGVRDRYRGAPALVYASSDRGPRAALVVSAAIH
jgi:3-oxoacyl-[acyl-carrier-protein] synthase I